VKERIAMDDTQLRAQATEVFRDIFALPGLELRDEMTAADVKGWDSLTHIDLVFAIERRFKIKLTTGEVSKLKNVGDLLSLVRRKVK
jgi:acyl carrier protein